MKQFFYKVKLFKNKIKMNLLPEHTPKNMQISQ